MSALSRALTHICVVHSPLGSKPQSNGPEAEDLGVATWFRSKKQIWPFMTLTYMYKSTYRLWIRSLGTNWEGTKQLGKVLGNQDGSACGPAFVMCC